MIVRDNARFQRCGLVAARAKQLEMELLYLPAYSLNLNIIERFWKFLKKEWPQNTSLESFERFTEAE